MQFPKNFLWGAAAAAYQIEGAYNEDGKVPGIWDALSDGHVKHGDNGNVACDHYHRFREDIALMKEIGLKSYRFSVSWPRIIVDEKGTVNPKGLQFYVELVNELTSVGIEPMCTLFHWNLPMWAYKMGGWKNEKIADLFADYAAVVVNALSDKVRYWMTINEPQCFVGLGYSQGAHAPFEKNDRDTVAKIMRVVMLAHGKAVNVIRSNAKQTPYIGFAMADTAVLPSSEREEDVKTAYEKTFASGSMAFGDGMVLGKFGGIMQGIVSDADKEIICQPLDFYGFNCYTGGNFADFSNGRNEWVKEGMPRTATDWVVSPEVLYWLPKFLYERYRLPLLVTENGMANLDWVMTDGKVHDPQRIDYMRRYLSCLKRAVNEKIPVIGYQYWSVMDNFEWSEGYDKRFGLIYVDYQTQKRIMKDSAYFYAEVIRTNGDNL